MAMALRLLAWRYSRVCVAAEDRIDSHGRTHSLALRAPSQHALEGRTRRFRNTLLRSLHHRSALNMAGSCSFNLKYCSKRLTA